MKEQLKETQQHQHPQHTVDREAILFEWCLGKTIAHLAREYSVTYHKMYRLIKSD